MTTRLSLVGQCHHRFASYRIGTFAPCANPVAGKAQVKSVIKVVLGSSRQWRTTILQVVLAVM
ncbi:hypothetical protein KOM34_004329 [Salmonella enterica]|nr:hypothetical protein [Salmonella enterica]